jgi:putative phosphoesterase
MAGPSRAQRVVVVSDTHVETARPRPGRGPGGLPPALWERLRGADAILHAGDVLDDGVLAALAAEAPTWAVLGNNDRSLVGTLPVTRTVELAGVRIGMVHDAGPWRGRAERLRRRFPDAAVVVFGHSHAPCAEPGVDGQLLLNPGSPTQRRAQPVHTCAELVLADGGIGSYRIVPLPPP